MKCLIALLFSICITVSIAEARILNIPAEFQTIQVAIDSSNDGDTVLVQPGEYRENLAISSHSITLASTMLNDPDNRAIIDETIVNSSDSGCGVRIEGVADEVIIIGFTITNAGWRGGNNQELGGGMRITGEAVVRLRSLILIGNHGRGGNGDGAAGIFAEGNIDIDASELSIVDNTAEDQASGALHLGNGVNMQLETGRISGNEALNSIISCFDASALILSHVEIRDNLSSSGTSYVVFIGRPSRLMMEDCVVTDNNGYRLIRTTDGIFRASRTLFVQGQGTISVNPLYFVVVNGIEAPNHLDNCTISGFSEDYTAAMGGAPTIITNSIVRGNGAGLDGNFTVRYSDIQGGWQGVGNIDSDPLFVDPANGDYHLAANSPCIDTGDPDSPLDPNGTRADMGAYVFHHRDIAVPNNQIDFGRLWVGETGERILTISNLGREPLQVGQIVISGDYFALEEEGDFELAPDSIRDVTISFAPEDSGEWRGNLLIVSDDPDEDSLTINLVGLGAFYPFSVPSDNLQSSTFNLHSAYPNPFNGQTTIRFSVGLETDLTRLAVYGVDGRLVQELWTGRNAYPPREKSVVWNAEGLPGGVYLIRLEAGREVKTLKAVLLR